MKAFSVDVLTKGCHPERSKLPAERATCGIEGLLPLLRLRARLDSVLKLTAATLREIFDESAYERFLARRNLTPSPASYADFRAEHETMKIRRPRCC